MFVNENDCQPRCRFTDSQQWETSYQEAVLASKDLINDEQLRRLRLNILIQEYQKKDLVDQILTRDNTLSSLEQRCENLSIKLIKAEEKALQQEKCLQSHESDLMDLRAGLRSLSKNSAQSVDQWAGISCISDELTNLKHEIENLRAIATIHERILEENLVLKQKIDSIGNNSASENYHDLHKDKSQGDLENKSIQKNQGMGQKEEYVLSDLSEKKEHSYEAIEDVFLKPQDQQEVVIDEGNQERSDIKFMNTLQELELSKIRQAALECELSKMYEKVADYEIQKNNLQADYDKSQSLLSSIQLNALEKQPNIKNQLRRDLRRKNTDASIGTPGGVAVRATRNSVKWGYSSEQTSIGEKSMFSITPFLNKTLDIEKELSGFEGEDFLANDAAMTSQIMSKDHTRNHPTITDIELKSSPQGLIKLTSQERPHIKRLASMIESQRVSSLTTSNETIQRVKRNKSDYLESLEKVIEEVNKDVNLPKKNEIATSSSSSLSLKALASNEKIQEVNENEKRKQKYKRTLLKVGAINLDNEGIELSSSEIEADYPAHRLHKKDKFPTLNGVIGEKLSTFSPLKRDRVRRDKNIAK
ncbi:putative smc domain-containing protein [Erysiphe neolycopersici]|uniref:Putative smc domain-containing protein n=1 Tax=Erysiphe neolycopersici TaxID=212602 RepID=A0A420HVU5_9PEZI|nr:putative smc domain-containing protein [Erysiphe neolycopersici]